jgi:hypothetical protein
MRIKEWNVAFYLKFIFLGSLLDFFPEKLGEFSCKQVERFNQDKLTDHNCPGFWKDSMLADIAP